MFKDVDNALTQGLDPSLPTAELEALLAQRLKPDSPNRGLYVEMLSTVVRMAQADRSRWDAKIMLQTLREMEQAFSTLEQFSARRKVTVFGSARTAPNHPIYQLTRELGQRLAEQQWMVITGAGNGVMAAAHEGAGLENSLGFNITLPFEQGANAVVHGSNNLLTFHFFFLRKLFFVKEADALVLCPGGFGTLDEALEALTLVQTGKSPIVPIVLLDSPEGTYWDSFLHYLREQLQASGYILPSDFQLVRLVHSAEQAVQEIARFYRNYHSSRWIKGQLCIRLQHPLSPEALSNLNREFADIVKAGQIEQRLADALENDEPELATLSRLRLDFNARDHGRLREMIDFINLPQNWAHST